MNSNIKEEKEDSNKNSSMNIFENLKSDFFLRKIFDKLNKNKSLKIINYNKRIQKRLKISINDYIEYSSIIIEIIPVKNEHGTFINIKKEEENFYHIYFDNNTEEIKRNYLEEKDKITKITIMIEYPVKSFEILFCNCKCVESINFIKFNRNNIINMKSMFYGCSFLKEINLSNFNTSNVIDMCKMFYGCSLLKELNLSNFSTNNVVDMNNMFGECKMLKQIKRFSVFNSIKVKDTSYMFYNCSSLIKLNISKFNTNKIKNMFGMFCGCRLGKVIQNKYKNFKENAFI